MKYFSKLLFFLLCLAPLGSLEAFNPFFAKKIQLSSSFSIKQDGYKVHINGMHPGKKNNELELNNRSKDNHTIESYLIRWHHAPSIYFTRDKEKDDANKIRYDPKNIFSFTGKGISLFGKFLASTDLSRLRLGIGGGIKCSFFKEMIGEYIGNNQQSQSIRYIPPATYYFSWSPVFHLGFKVIENTSYTLLIDGNWPPSMYNFSELDRSYSWSYNRTFDLGTTLEKQFSTNLHWSLRCAYGLCLYNEVVESYDPSNIYDLISVSHYINSIIIQLGFGIAIPISGSCPVMGCYTKLDHKHHGNDYIGA